MFSKIFRPKWQHRKAEVRIAALNELDAQDPVLVQLAGNDADPAVRRQALRRIGDLSSLVHLVAAEPDEAVREIASKRLKRLLAGEEEGGPVPAVRRQLLLELGDEELLGYVLRHAAEPELRQSALAAVSRPSLLAEVALSDPNGELRLAALERIDRSATLERIARQAKGKDKRVARRARERVDAMRTEAERPERQVAICEALEHLVEQGGVDLITCGRLQKEWEALAPAVTAELAKRFASGCEAFARAQARLQAEAALSARQRELCERIEELQRGVEGNEADLIGMDSAITLLQRAWQTLEEEASSLSPALAERFSRAYNRTVQRRSERLAQREELARLQGVFDTLTALLGENADCDAAALERIEAEWQAAGGGNKHGHTEPLRTRFNHSLRQARRRLGEEGQEREQLQKTLGELLSQLEAALDAGQLQQAASSHDKVRDRMAKLRQRGGAASAAQQKRLHAAVTRLHELRDWRRFGTDRARETLLAQMGALAQGTLAPQKLAEAIKALRNEWRLLDRKDGPASEALWQAFDQAAETAYAPCRDHFEALQQERRQHLERREGLLNELEQAYAAVDWQAPDWSGLDQQLQQAKKRWQKLGGVEHREWQVLNGRFRQLMERFEQHLAPQREQEKARREGLIAMLEQLAEEADLDKVLAETKAAQAAWKPLISVQPRVEQGLWRRFKAACDAVYARQREQSQAQRETEQSELARLQQLCDEIDSLAASMDAEKLSPRRARLAELKRQWREADSRLVRSNKALAKRFEAALAAFERAEAAIAQGLAAAERDLLLQKVASCEALEGLLFDGEGTKAAPLLASWQALPALRDTSLEQALQARVAQAQRALLEGGDRLAGVTVAAAENLAQREALCLRLELLAGVPSPPAFNEARLAMQVGMLSDAMTGQLAGAERGEAARRLLGEYLATGAVPPQERDALAVRLQTVLASGVVSCDAS